MVCGFRDVGAGPLDSVEKGGGRGMKLLIVVVEWRLV